MPRPAIAREVRDLTRKMSESNPARGSPRIRSELVSLDFFTVSTVRFEVLFVLIILAHDRRRVVHFNITTKPTVRWTGQQVVETFPWDTAPSFLLRDRDGVYGADFRRRVESMGIEEVVIAPRASSSR